MTGTRLPVRIVILTTDTLHHTRFVEEMTRRFEVVGVFEEKRELSISFQLHHEFEDMRDAHERDTWFSGQHRGLADVCDVQTYRDMNDEQVVTEIGTLAPDAIIAFGTGRLNRPILEIMPDRLVNLHGADPEHYRGLDTHLWAVYHSDFRSLVTTLHKISASHNRGGVVIKAPLDIRHGMGLEHLRQVNTDTCINITTQGLRMLHDYGQFISQPQLYVGRHYSFMPSVLKDRCVQKFKAYTDGL